VEAPTPLPFSSLVDALTADALGEALDATPAAQYASCADALSQVTSRTARRGRRPRGHGRQALRPAAVATPRLR